MPQFQQNFAPALGRCPHQLKVRICPAIECFGFAFGADALAREGVKLLGFSHGQGPQQQSVDQAEDLCRPLPEEFYKLARRYWPGPLTIIVKAASRLPLKVTANTGNVALRVPNAKIPLAVVQAAQIPITATSANLSGESECTTAVAVRDQLQGRISIIVDGGTSPREVPSTIVDLTDEEARWRIMREGAIPAQEISEFFAQG
jgi:tRNA threonylcarbamoyl adenosine modification protein (Sua5/YciO/YrdC/YwlC family)